MALPFWSLYDFRVSKTLQDRIKSHLSKTSAWVSHMHKPSAAHCFELHFLGSFSLLFMMKFLFIPYLGCLLYRRDLTVKMLFSAMVSCFALSLIWGCWILYSKGVFFLVELPSLELTTTSSSRTIATTPAATAASCQVFGATDTLFGWSSSGSCDSSTTSWGSSWSRTGWCSSS